MIFGKYPAIRNFITRSHSRLLMHCRRYSLLPNQTDYDIIAVENMDLAIGTKRFESSKVEAAMRRIAQQLFLNDSTQRSLIEQEILDDGKLIMNLPEDARDLAPRPKPLGQNKLSAKLQEVLRKDNDHLQADVARLLWQYQVRYVGTYNFVCRKLISFGKPFAALQVMKGMLRVPRNNLLDVSTFQLCLELAMINYDIQWFRELSGRIELNESEWTNSQRIFDVPQCHARIEVMLAEGYMKFRLLDQLDRCVNRNKDKPFYIKILAVNLEAAHRFHNTSRANFSLSEFKRIWDPRKRMSTQVLSLANKIPELKPEVQKMLEQLPPNRRQEFDCSRSAYPRLYTRWSFNEKEAMEKKLGKAFIARTKKNSANLHPIVTY